MADRGVRRVGRPRGAIAIPITALALVLAVSFALWTRGDLNPLICDGDCGPAYVTAPVALTPASVPASEPEDPAPRGSIDAAKVQTATAGTLGDDALGKHVGLVIVGATGELLASQGSGTFIPASTAKLLTGFAALSAVGPQERFKTSVVLAGKQLVLVGGGDPYLLTKMPKRPDRAFRADLTTLAARTAAALKRDGVKAVSLGYDASLFSGRQVILTPLPQTAPAGIARQDGVDRVGVFETPPDGLRVYRTDLVPETETNGIAVAVARPDALAAVDAGVASGRWFDDATRGLFRWLGFLVATPVVLYSAQPFFAGAVRSLRAGRMGMDVPVALAVAMIYAASLYVAVLGGAEVYFDSVSMFVFFLLTGRWLELRLRDRTAGALEALMNRLPDSVERRGDDGRFVRVGVRRIALGDVLRVLPGEVFPADGPLLAGSTRVDEALLTGESAPRWRTGACAFSLEKVSQSANTARTSS